METQLTESDDAVAGERSQLAQQRFVLFSRCWAAAALFHLAGNPRPDFLPPSTLFTLVQLGVGIAAGAVLVVPRWHRPMLALCALIPLSAWLEAPIVGNHWVLAAAISLCFLAATAVGATRRDKSPVSTEGLWAAFAPTARVSLLIAYSFAAFAKLNSGFFDPAVSCAVFYQDQLVRSWGLGALSVAGRPALGLASAVGAAAIELSVPVLLFVRRTRRIGLVLALLFHWMLALDLSQHFWDFSAVLLAAFLLFLGDAQVKYILASVERLRGLVRPALRRAAVGGGVTAAAVVLAATLLPGPGVLRGLAILAGHGAWIVLGTAMIGLVIVATVRTQPAPVPHALRVRAIPLLLVPVLVFINGLTPYLELKTGFGWNMYANLRTVAGETNHFVVPASLDLTGLQGDRVEILESSDPALVLLVGTGYELPYSEFREYAHLYPDATVVYRRGGTVHTAKPLRDDPAGTGGVSVLSQRLQSFRVIDRSGSERCQAVFTPAR